VIVTVEKNLLHISDWIDSELFDIPIPTEKPLLAHYTSIAQLKAILLSREIWFSNPLLMNDFQELNFALHHGASILRTNGEILAALSTDQNRQLYDSYIEGEFSVFTELQSVDVYAFCLSECEPNKPDGELSMWRGYGGNGSGAALIFDLSKAKLIDGSPVQIVKVNYCSNDEQLDWIKKLATKVASAIRRSALLSGPLFEMEIKKLAGALCNRIILFGLSTKHIGFADEREWRVFYLTKWDAQNLLKDRVHSSEGRFGLELKLKVPLAPMKGVFDESITIDNLVHSILLGPTSSSFLARQAARRMLHEIGHPNLFGKIRSSMIPYRPRPI
jgi:Protein of unknown function (DUF2971)